MTTTEKNVTPHPLSPSLSQEDPQMQPKPSVLSYPTAETIPFPYEKPYPEQRDLMNALLRGISSTSNTSSSSPCGKAKILCLESPTGTGKSLSLACAALAWLEYQEQQEQLLVPDGEDFTPSSPHPPSSAGLDWIDDWQPTQQQEQQQQSQQQQHSQTKARQACQQQQKCLLKIDEIRKHLIQQTQDLSLSSQDTKQQHQQQQQRIRERILRQAITQAKVQARKRQRQRRLQRNTTPALAYESDEEDNLPSTGLPRRQARMDPESPEWLLQTPWQESSLTITQPQQTAYRKQRQIIYAARTHSQLSQFLKELARTKWGPTTRVIALGSRSQGLCGNFQKSSQTEAQMAEACWELRQNNNSSKAKKRTSSETSSTSCGCLYYDTSAMATLALHALAQPTDLEEMIHLGQATRTCAYYASRMALSQAQVIVMPYPLLMDPSSRQAWGVQLRDNLVLIDEAHNLPQAIQNVTSARLSFRMCQGALQQLNRYLDRYLQDRLNAQHIKLLGQLKKCLQGFQKSMSMIPPSPLPTTKQHAPQSRELMDIPLFLCRYKLDAINLFPLLRYMKTSRLAQKLMGFRKDPMALKNNDDDNDKDASLPSHISPMSVVEGFLNKLNDFDRQHAKLVVQVQHPDSTFTPTTTMSATTTSTTEQENDSYLELVVLNPAVHAQDELYQLPHAVCLVGGTLQPMDVLMQELAPSHTYHARQAQQKIAQHHHRSASNNTTSVIYESDSFVGFSCGHVVSPSNVLLQAISQVGSTTLDLRHSHRSTPAVLQALGQAVVECACIIPHGMVLFVPSYSYEQVLVQAWQRMKWKNETKGFTIWDHLTNIKPIFREPKQRTQLEETLTQFSHQAKDHNKKGALLIAVVGGKLSEGINFADDLCRGVLIAGMPFADKSDPILQEKLRQMEQPQQYYQSLCIRGVNQSVGRAIRHAHDYAAILLLDARYPSQDSIARSLPQWLTRSTPGWRQPANHRLDRAIQNLEQFFARLPS